FSPTPMSSAILYGGEQEPLSFASAISGSYAYLAEQSWDIPNASNGRIEIVDITNPAAPVLVGTVNLAGALPNAVAVDGSYMYVVTNYGTRTVHVFNVANPQNPTFVITLPGTSNPQTVGADGQLVFVADLNRGLLIYNVADPSNPALVGTFAGSYAD